jgi:hypothetical protein
VLLANEVIALKALYGRYKAILEASDDSVAFGESLPTKCSREHLILLCWEADKGVAKYPADKLNRWLGFVQGVMSCTDIGSASGRQSDYRTLSVSECLASLKASKGLEVPFVLPVECRNHRLQVLCEAMLLTMDFKPSDELHRTLGYIQGVLAARGMIDVDVERNFSRPLLHAMHQAPIPTFP